MTSEIPPVESEVANPRKGLPRLLPKSFYGALKRRSAVSRCGGSLGWAGVGQGKINPSSVGQECPTHTGLGRNLTAGAEARFLFGSDRRPEGLPRPKAVGSGALARQGSFDCAMSSLCEGMASLRMTRWRGGDGKAGARSFAPARSSGAQTARLWTKCVQRVVSRL